MQRLLLAGPAITVAEVVFLAVAISLLLLVPAVFAVVDRRRQALAVRPSPVSELPALTPSPSAETFESQGQGSEAQTEEAWTPWPVAPPPPSMDPWHPDETAAPVPAAAPTTVTTVLRETPSEPMTPRCEPPLESPPSWGAITEWRDPAQRYAALPPLPENEPQNSNVRTRLEVLREVSLGTWPGVIASFPPTVRTVWEEGARAYRAWHAHISQLEVPLPEGMASYALGRVESDENKLRLHFLVFDHLWPTQPDEARAVLIIDLDRHRGPLACAMVRPVLTR